jgi:hypothetical protein
MTEAMRKIHLLSMFVFIACCFSSLNTFSQLSIGGYNVYFGSLHNHTSYSDGQGTPDQAYAYAKNTGGLDFFGLADHSEMLNSTEWSTIKTAANNANQDGIFTTFYGFEWSSFWSYGHVAVINTDDYCSYLSTNSFDKLLSWLNTRNGIAFFNHPGWESTAFKEFDHFTDTPSSKFVGMELWNDHDGFSKYYYNNGYYSNDGTKGYFDEALIRGWKIGASGSDDNHTATWGTATPMRMAVLANAKTRTDILNALIARRFYSTLDKNLTLSFKIGGSEMGSTVTAGMLVADILASDAENEVVTKIELRKNGAVINTWYPNQANPVISQQLTCSAGEYYYVKVTQYDGNEAISSPIFISGQANLSPVVAISSPVNGAAFTSGSTITITANASDADGTITKVEFYQGSVKLGEDNSIPYSYDWTNVPAGNYALTAKAYDNLGAATTSGVVNIIVSTPSLVTVSSRISSGNDDVEESINGSVVLNSDDLELVYDTRTTGNQTVGLLFRNLNIPVGASISKAYIQFAVDERSTASCSLKITGEASDNATAFSTTSYNVSGRAKTSIVSWIPASWNTVGASSTGQQTPDIKSIIQEIVNRPAWNPSGNLVIIITGTGKRVAESYEGLPAKAPMLYVEYTPTKSQAAIVTETAMNQKNKPSEARITLFPNPASDDFIVRLESTGSMESISIYNTTGVLINKFYPGSEDKETRINCSSYPPGLYFVKIETENGSTIAKLIKK